MYTHIVRDTPALRFNRPGCQYGSHLVITHKLWNFDRNHGAYQMHILAKRGRVASGIQLPDVTDIKL